MSILYVIERINATKNEVWAYVDLSNGKHLAIWGPRSPAGGFSRISSKECEGLGGVKHSKKLGEGYTSRGTISLAVNNAATRTSLKALHPGLTALLVQYGALSLQDATAQAASRTKASVPPRAKRVEPDYSSEISWLLGE